MGDLTDITVTGSVFQGSGKDGDFGWMILQPQYAKSFFIFNDNETQWMAHIDDPTGSLGCVPGAGNGAIRPYQCQIPPRCLGIPTGDGGIGYQELTAHVKSVIDTATANIADAIRATGATQVIYSSDGQGGLGTGTFRVGPEVTRYIVAVIEGLATDP